MNRMKALVVAGIVLVIAVVAWGWKEVGSQHACPPVAKAPVSVTPWGWKEVSFRKDVYPILQQNCAVCHTPGAVGYAQSGFSVQSYQSVMRGTKYGPMVIPGSSLSSNLVVLLEHAASPSISMPKMYQVMIRNHRKYIVPSGQARRLSPHDVRLIKEWVDQGAKDN